MSEYPPEPVPAVQDAGEGLAQRPDVQTHGVRQQEHLQSGRGAVRSSSHHTPYLLGLHQAQLRRPAVAEHAASVTRAAVLAEVDLAWTRDS